MLQEQFTDLKERFEAICKKVDEETKATDVLVQVSRHATRVPRASHCSVHPYPTHHTPQLP